MSISAIIITKNEEKTIAGCMNALSFCDEIIVVDNKSQDKTVEIAKKKGAKVFVTAGLDFSYLRNVGKEKSSGEWLINIDADEIVSKKLANEIRSVIKRKQKFSSYFIKRQNYYLKHKWPKTELMLRLIREDSLIGWQGNLHETPIVTGESGVLSNIMPHYSHTDIGMMVKKTNQWSEAESRLLFNSNHPLMSWWRFMRIMISSFLKSYFNNGGWQMGEAGIVESTYQSFSSFITYAKLWEKQSLMERVKNQEIKR
ncbi:hypothetical protein A2Y99_02260 [Candidatus Gottesmanbacteria bacterium RBG_13_37_7]|uniref:Glycosyltransferase 2-like domain-containing protein n=1 Tax=Candidatus Gottesmanbacteria bacterium RBG_13_37_7 TaxID=1798369 RepID=A0A1F5YHG4_9BACT|nr:MAG: hypothetical protein A2Y99_02260 [Candidatus Gottesmanbacteria bacterium RBG_13_37_7]